MRNFHFTGRSTAYAANAMAATSSPFATLAAIEVLKSGGNAVDAAVTASAVLCVSEPHMTGIGGDGFVLVGKPDGTFEGLNGSGRAAKRADADWLKRSGLGTIPERSPHAVTVPGAIDAWDRLLRRYGTIDLGQALKPAIDLARAGVPTTPRVAYDWARNAAKLASDEGAREHFLLRGRAPRVGEVMRYPAFARTLERVAREGRDGFYTGEVAEEIVSLLAERGGLLTLEDFAATEATWVAPIRSEFASREMLEIPPNGQGLTALIALNILKRCDISRHAPDSAERYHLQVEAIRLAFVLRNRHIADPAFAEVPVDRLLSDRVADELASRIDMDRALKPDEATTPPRGDTIYLCAVDKDRLAVSFINSVYSSWGTGIVTPESGFALHNRGQCFVTDPDHPNCIGPGKRPLHTIIPAMVAESGKVAMPFGVMGADFQPMGHVQLILNMFVYGMDVQQAIDWPRVFHDYVSGRLGVEQSLPRSAVEGLSRRGHAVATMLEPLGGGQAILIDWKDGVLAGGSDPRKDGLALGY